MGWTPEGAVRPSFALMVGASEGKGRIVSPEGAPVREGKKHMVGGTHIYGGFNLSPYLALRVFEAVKEITTQNVDISLSHVDDDNCEICRSAQAKAKQESGNDAAQPGRPGREWAA